VSEDVTQQPQVVYVKSASNGVALGALICAIVGAGAGLIPIMFWLALPLGVLGVILGIVGRRRVKAEPPIGRKATATWAIAVGLIAVALGVVGVAIVNDAANDLDRAADQLDHAAAKLKQTR
jgi:hypothetical protein